VATTFTGKTTHYAFISVCSITHFSSEPPNGRFYLRGGLPQLRQTSAVLNADGMNILQAQKAPSACKTLLGAWSLHHSPHKPHNIRPQVLHECIDSTVVTLLQPPHPIDFDNSIQMFCIEAPNGLRYPRGGLERSPKFITVPPRRVYALLAAAHNALKRSSGDNH